jgi:hypothetical protein
MNVAKGHQPGNGVRKDDAATAIKAAATVVKATKT